jgi:hypothetical protein
MRRSCKGHAFSLLERSRSCSGVTSPGCPSDRSLTAAGRSAVVSSGAISSIVDLKRTAGGVSDFCSPPAAKGALWTASKKARTKVSRETLVILSDLIVSRMSLASRYLSQAAWGSKRRGNRRVFWRVSQTHLPEQKTPVVAADPAPGEPRKP